MTFVDPMGRTYDVFVPLDQTEVVSENGVCEICITMKPKILSAVSQNGPLHWFHICEDCLARMTEKIRKGKR